MIRIHNLSKIYKHKGVETRALSEVSLQVKQGEFVSIMGPSGCGKTTLLNIIGLLDGYDEGLLLLDGQDVSELKGKQKLEWRKQNIGFVFQNFNLIEDLTVRENLALPLHYLGLARANQDQKVEAILEQVGMAHRKDYFPYQLSGGQQQRVAVARALITEPKLLLADEPTGNLDTQHGKELMELLSQLNEQGTTIVMVTHSHRDASYSERIIHFLDGTPLSEKQVLHAQF